MENQDDLKRAYRISLVVGIAILASLFIYAIVVFWFKSWFTPASGSTSIQNIGWLRYIFYALSVGMIILLRVLRGVKCSSEGFNELPLSPWL